MKKNFWSDKTVLITGHTGFKGSWLSLCLNSLGAKVIGYSKDIPTNPSLFKLADVSSGIKTIKGDIRDYKKIYDVIIKSEPDIIFHLAAQSLVRESYSNPRNTFETNVMGTVNIFDTLRKNERKQVIVNVTSDKCYLNEGFDKEYIEDDPLGGLDPYSSSKSCSELITMAYRNSFFDIENKKFLASVRAGNVIGGGDWAKDRLIPDIIQSIFNKKSIKIRNPDAIRHWQHVLDPLNGYILLAEKIWVHGKKYCQPWNFGPDDQGKSVSWLVEKISEMLEKKCIFISDNKDEPYESKILKLNSEKAKKNLGWEPKINIQKGLELTAEWYKEYKNNSNMRKVTEKQIDTFFQHKKYE